MKAAGKKRLTHPFPEMFCKTEDPFYFTFLLSLPLYSAFWLELLSSSLSGSIKKKTGIQTPTRWLFRDISLPSSRSARPLNKVIFLVSTPHLQFIGLSCGEQSQYGLGNISVASCCPLSGHTLLTFSSLQVLTLCLSGIWPVECIVSTGRNSFLPWLPLSLLLILEYHAA